MADEAWGNPLLHPNKRSLSVYEKQTILATGRALLMPGEPPGPDERGEIEELVGAGFALSDISGVERSPQVAERLYEHYYDQAQVHLEEVETFVNRSTSSFAYAHFDFCTSLTPDYVRMLGEWPPRMAPVCRLRVSVQTTRRRREQRSYETHLYRHLVMPLAALAGVEVEEEDLTQLIACIWLLNASFGQSTFTFIDETCQGRQVLPEPVGTHQICNLRRFTYHEPIGHTVMSTIWADMIALDQNAPVSPEMSLQLVRNLLLALSVPLSSFTTTDLA